MERAQGGGSIAYLTKYTFKSPTNLELELATNPEEDITGTGIESYIARDNIRNDLRLYIRARVTGSVEAVWILLEFRRSKTGPRI